MNHPVKFLDGDNKTKLVPASFSDKNTLPNKSGNPESLKNNHSSWKALQLMCT